MQTLKRIEVSRHPAAETAINLQREAVSTRAGNRT
jgi:hypothetical protein